MLQILKNHPAYGRPRMTVELRERLGYRINPKRVGRLLRDNGWGVIRYLPRPGKSGVQKIFHQRKGSLDKVSGREFGVLKAFSTDFTELRYSQGRRKAWLMTLSDLESRWAAGWSVGSQKNRSLALRCWEQAKQKLDLLQLAAHFVTEACTGSPKVMRCHLRHTELRGVLFDDMPHNLLRHAFAPGCSRSTNTPK